MNLLLILLSVMTFTVQTKNTVTMDGTWPYSITVDYDNNSSQGKGNVGQNDVACLTLGELGGITVEQIEIYMRSNKTAGAGNIEVHMDAGYPIATKSGTFRDWTGSYDDQNYHAISLLSQSVSNIHNLTIQVVGTTSSLHIEKYVITYGNAPARTVKLMDGDAVYSSLKETTGGQGVMLPSLANKDNWKFVGWSDTEFESLSVLPDLYAANNRFYPDENCTLWAVYKYVTNEERVYVTDLQSGDYLYVNRTSDLALAGVPEEGIMDRGTCNLRDADQYYHIEFTPSLDTAYITHTITNTPIGYSGTSMACNPSPWLVYHESDQTLFYAVINGKTYLLWLNIMDSGNQGTYAGLIQATPGASPMGLVAVPQGADTPYYTCHPEHGMDIVAPNAEGAEYTIYFGIYELHIINGQKQLRLRQ